MGSFYCLIHFYKRIVMSRYPSAYGHTPSYRSVASTVYPSALGRDPLDVPASLLGTGLGARSTLDREFDRTLNREFDRKLDREFDRTFEKDFSRNLDSDLSFSSGLGGRSALSDLEHDLKFSSLSSRARSPLLNTNNAHSASSSTYKAEKYSSSSMSSANGDLPHRESHQDSTYRSTRIGDSGIPHTSYGHSSSSYDSDRPYKNAVSNFSYNI